MAKRRPAEGRPTRVAGGSRWPRRPALAALAVLPAVLVASCSTLEPDATAAAGVASAFHRAVQDADGNASCALLAPATVEKKFEAADSVFTVAEFDEQLTPYFDGRSPHQTFAAYSVAQLDTTGIANLAN